MICCKCQVGEVPLDNGVRPPLCRNCRAELVLMGEEQRLGVMDRAYADQAAGQVTPVTWEELQLLQPAHPFENRKIRCGACGTSESYDPMQKRQGWPCERCHRHILKCCAAYVVIEGKPVTMCKFCRAELELSGQPVGETLKDLPGTEKQP